jgi:hypothetical protein
MQAAPLHPPFTPSSPGILITLPQRALHFGEAFNVTITAVNPLAEGLTGWSVPLRFDNTQLQLLGVETSSLWLDATTSSRAALGSATVITVASDARAPGQVSERYRTASTIPLAELAFVVRTSVPGTYPTAVSMARGALLAPSWLAPPTEFHDHRTGTFSAGSINVTMAQTLGLWAWPDLADVFNTAHFTGGRVSARLQAAVVHSWGVALASPTTPTSCTLSDASGAAAAVFLDSAQCMVSVEAVNTVPAKDLAVTLGASGFVATVVLSVWQPVKARVDADDTTLNSVLPLNAGPLGGGCYERYQSTRLRARTDWTNGGSTPTDTIAAADITQLATFSSNDSSVVQVLGANVRGIAPGYVAVGIAGLAPPAAPALLAVSDTPTCLLAIQPLAITGVDLVGAPPVLLPAAQGQAVLAWRAAQSMVWEGAAARVVTLASFSDGATMDVSDRAVVSLVAGAANMAPPFKLSADIGGAPLVAVNASISGAGATSACGAFLAASWEVCLRSLGSGQGRVVLALPAPQAVINLTADPSVIASGSDPAAQPPISLPTDAQLALAVAFSDGTQHDFSNDARTSFVVSAGTTLCTVQQAANGAWCVVAAPGSGGLAGGSCTITARVAFSDAAALAATVTVSVVNLRAALLYDMPPSTLSPPTLQTALVPMSASLKLLRCDARNYDQRTLWPMAVLSNCSSTPGVCSMTDLANHQWVSLSSSNEDVFRVMRGYPSDPGALGPGT